MRLVEFKWSYFCCCVPFCLHHLVGLPGIKMDTDAHIWLCLFSRLDSVNCTLRFWFLNSKESWILTTKIVQARDIEKALDGFTRAVQLDPENGEAWNNIACLYVFLTHITCVMRILDNFMVWSINIHACLYAFLAYN